MSPTAAAESLQAQAVVHLVVGGASDAADRAVAELERATALPSAGGPERSARLWSDLAAAYLVRAGRKDSAMDLIRSLEAAGAALAADPQLPEARFNRALALERLGLRLQATVAWEEVRHTDHAAGWVAEARLHLADLRQLRGRGAWQERRADLDRASLTGDAATVRRLVAAAPQAAREYAVEDLLGRWGAAWLDRQSGLEGDDERRSLQIARVVGRALADGGGDATAAGAVSAIDRAGGAGGSPGTGRGAEARLEALARGHRAYSTGMALSQRLAIEDAGPLLVDARRWLERGASPVAGWAAVALAGIAGYRARLGEAAAEFHDILRETAPDRLPALIGRARWGLAWLEGRQGHLDVALDLYRQAADSYRAAGETENVGAVEGLIGESLQLLGEDPLAWRHRYLALARLEDDLSSLHLHSALLEAARSAAEEGAPRAALELASEDEAVAARSGDPLNLAEVLLWRSRIQLRAGRPASAREDLALARQQVARGPAGLMRLRSEIDIEYAEADLMRRSQPAAVLAPLSRAVAFYAAGGLVWSLMPAYASRARAEIAVGRQAAADADFAAAVGLYQREGRSTTLRAQRRAFAAEARELCEAMIAWRADHAPPPALAALAASEQARALALPYLPAAAAAPVYVLPPGVAVLEYAALPDRLLIWLVSSGGVQLFERALPAAALAEQVRLFDATLLRRSSGELDAAAKRLYAELMPAGLDAVAGGAELAIVPDLSLNQLPFAALVNPRTGRYLVQEHALALAASVASYAAAGSGAVDRGGPSAWSALLVGDPAFDGRDFPWLSRLPRAEAEVRTLGAIYPRSTTLMRERATKSAVLAEIPAHEILHYAGHAVANAEEPGLSYLPLATAPQAAGGGSGALFAEELEGRRLGRLRLVVLSACSTIKPRDTRAGGPAGWAQPFLEAGAAAVLGTLWNVDDRAAERLLTDFHRRFRRQGDAAQALREAQLAMLADPDGSFSHPATWAGFALVGRLHQQP